MKFYRSWGFIALLYVLAFLFHCKVNASPFTKVMAFACAWEGGDMIFATDVKDGQTEIVRSYPGNEEGETWKIKITDLKSRVSYATLSIIRSKKITVQTVKCIMEQE